MSLENLSGSSKSHPNRNLRFGVSPQPRRPRKRVTMQAASPPPARLAGAEPGPERAGPDPRPIRTTSETSRSLFRGVIDVGNLAKYYRPCNLCGSCVPGGSACGAVAGLYKVGGPVILIPPLSAGKSTPYRSPCRPRDPQSFRSPARGLHSGGLRPLPGCSPAVGTVVKSAQEAAFISRHLQLLWPRAFLRAICSVAFCE